MRYVHSWIRILAVAATACLLCVAVSQARKPDNPGQGGGGGGGEPGQNGGGKIYFSYNSDLYTMNDDGSGIALVAGFPAEFPIWGEPSRHQHNAKRWFVQIHGDRFVALSDVGDVVPLGLPPQLEYLQQPRWGVGDGFVSWIGRRRDLDPDSESFGAFVEGGVYGTVLVFDDDGDVAGSAETDLLVPISLNEETPDILSHDWLPDGTRLVFHTQADRALIIADLLLEEFEPLIAGGLSEWTSPRWSAQDKLVFFYNPPKGRSGLYIMNIDGSGLTLIEAYKISQHPEAGHWSPTGSHLLYHHVDHRREDSYLVRTTQDGRDAQRLTDTNLGAGFDTPRVLGWRE